MCVFLPHRNCVGKKEGELGFQRQSPPTTLPYSPLLFLIVLRHLARVSAHGPTYARARDQPIPDPMDDGYNINKSSPEDGIRNQKEKRDACLAV